MKYMLALFLLATTLQAETDQNFTYEQQRESVVEGNVLKVGKIKRPQDNGTGIHALIKTDQDTVLLLLGPEQYLKEIGLSMQEGDRVSARGIIIRQDDRLVMITRLIEMNGHKYTLRDRPGF